MRHDGLERDSEVEDYSCRIRITKQLEVQSEQEEEGETRQRPTSRHKSKRSRKEPTESHTEELEEKVCSISVSINTREVPPA